MKKKYKHLPVDEETHRKITLMKLERGEKSVCEVIKKGMKL